jgi:hypothetical protein
MYVRHFLAGKPLHISHGDHTYQLGGEFNEAGTHRSSLPDILIRQGSTDMQFIFVK